jgi:uncharacterized protein (TIGR03435 family)
MKLLAIFIALTAPVLAQPAFEVASIKPSPIGGRMTLGSLAGGKLTAHAIDIKTLIRAAYRVQDFQISGSAFDSQRYDIEAKGDPAASAVDTRLMLQALLADRFHLKVRHDTKEVPAYKLVLANGRTTKMTKADGTGCDPEPSPANPCGRIHDAGAYVLVGEKVSMPLFVTALGSLLSDTVVDQTGLDGVYDFKLDLGHAGFSPTPGSATNQMDGVTAVMAALPDQLGLKLERTKSTVEILVIERVERPSAN